MQPVKKQKQATACTRPQRQRPPLTVPAPVAHSVHDGTLSPTTATRPPWLDSARCMRRIDTARGVVAAAAPQPRPSAPPPTAHAECLYVIAAGGALPPPWMRGQAQ